MSLKEKLILSLASTAQLTTNAVLGVELGNKNPLMINVLKSGARAECHPKGTINREGSGKGEADMVVVRAGNQIFPGFLPVI